MTDDTKPKSFEIVLRALVRLPAELISRPPKDEDDFVRRKLYRKTGKPENGISLFRKDKFETAQDVWDRLGMSNPVGLSECAFGKIEAKGLQHKVTGDKSEHISLRCPDCDMSDLPTICKPVKANHFCECPFSTAKLQKSYRKRRQALVYSLSLAFGKLIEIATTGGGTHISLRFNFDVQKTRVLEAASTCGLKMISMDDYYFDERVTKQYVVYFTNVSMSAIEEQVALFKRHLSDHS